MPESKDMNKKRKTTEEKQETPKTVVKADENVEKKEEKPWEGKEEQEEDYRWNVCENCQ
jgi:hypothetical protein